MDLPGMPAFQQALRRGWPTGGLFAPDALLTEFSPLLRIKRAAPELPRSGFEFAPRAVGHRGAVEIGIETMCATIFAKLGAGWRCVTSMRCVGLSRTMSARASLPRSLCALFSILACTWSGAALADGSRQRDWAEFQRLADTAQRLMMAHPEQGISTARRAMAIADRHKGEPDYNHAAAVSLWLEAEGLTRTNHIADARAAVTAASRLAAKDAKPNRLDGDLALSRARIAESMGDLASALKNYQLAHAVFAQFGIARSQSIALLGLGDLYEKARDFDRQTRYYRDAVKIYSGDSEIALAATNNLGRVFEHIGQYRQAIPLFRKALKIAGTLKSPILQASILNNLAISYARLREFAEADRAADHSLMLLPKNDSGDVRFVWGTKGEIEYRRGNLHAGAADLERAFHGIDLRTTQPSFRDMHEIAYLVSRAKGDLALALAHHEALKRLDDEGRSLAASANLALLAARFDFERQDLEIAHLKAADLERDIKLRNSRAEIQSMVFAGIFVAGMLLFGWVGWRHSLLERHRNDMVKTLAERDMEIERRTAVESHLRLAIEAVEQASRAKSHFLANMSHELRTPLNAIIGFSELMRSGLMKPEKTHEYAGNIAAGGHHLLAVLNNVLDMARLEAGKVELQDQLVRLGDVVDHAVAMIGGREAHAGKELRASGDGDVVVRGDEVRLRQALINLVFNAVKFTGERGVIEIRIENAIDGVDLVVQDDGEGIPANKLITIMEPFVQAESTYSRSHGGAGLGLPIVKSLVELHGGRFTIESEHWQGTTARIHLPEHRVVDASRESAAARGDWALTSLIQAA
jgi:signal transduction histidine kinase